MILETNEIKTLDNLDTVFQEASERINTVAIEKLNKLERDTKNDLKALKIDTELKLDKILRKSI